MSSVRLRYQTLEFDNFDIHIRSLRDTQQFLDVGQVAEKLGISSANWSLFGVIWASGEVLARYIVDYDIEGKRILEVGCGIALASLVLNQRGGNITATDYHPEAGRFLEENVLLNKGPTIPFVRTAWEDTESVLGQYDLIIGSDLLYESGHVLTLSNFIERHASQHCEVIIVDPGRGNHSRFSREMQRLGYSLHQTVIKTDENISPQFKGRILEYRRH
ncbi:class I SAM-dependent methyltransferase [Hahella ganghwensis]|uniref:class I SAM-dependent methyltransferase n=1 Tax=Hahella ganghwensis TaxID=286420 RepID=UPI00037DCA5D|nr:hypothetical protein [Hahella ganghwensis]